MMNGRIDSVNFGDGVSFPRTRGFCAQTEEKVVPMELGVNLVPIEGHFSHWSEKVRKNSPKSRAYGRAR